MRRLFYDTSCPACKSVVKMLDDPKRKKLFMVSSLDGKKAKLVFSGNYAFIRNKKSKIVILEGKKVWSKGNAMLRPFWLIGGKYKAIGIFSYLPSFLLAPAIFIWVKIAKLLSKKK